MKLFHQLTDEQKDNAIHYCLNIILHDIFEHGMELDPPSDEEKEVVEKVMSAVKAAKALPTIDDQIDALMSDDDINSILHDAAHEMSLTCYYPSSDDMVIFEDEISPEKPEIIAEKKMLN